MPETAPGVASGRPRHGIVRSAWRHGAARGTSRNVKLLTGKQRRFLRALSHHLDPVLQVGKEGLTAAVLKELERALIAHELLKLRVLRECPTPKAEIETAIAEAMRAHVVQSVGRVISVYRGKKKDPKIKLPVATASGGA